TTRSLLAGSKFCAFALSKTASQPSWPNSNSGRPKVSRLLRNPLPRWPQGRSRARRHNRRPTMQAKDYVKQRICQLHDNWDALMNAISKEGVSAEEMVKTMPTLFKAIHDFNSVIVQTSATLAKRRWESATRGNKKPAAKVKRKD